MRSPTLLACLAALLIGCGPAPAPSGAGDQPSAVPLGADVAARSPSIAAGPSFGPWKNRLDELLTLELAAEAAGLPAAAAEKDYIDGLPQIAYTWPSDRKEAYGGMQLSKKNRVSIANIQTGVTPEFFRSRFRAASETELAQVDKEADRQAAERGLDKPQAADVSDLAAALSAVSPSEELTGVGDLAVWETGEHEQVLYVLFNGSSLRMTVDISDDPDANRAAAVALARRLIQRL
ncbi:MAG: hypothetical protein K0M70_03845 [Arenimonas sp.]|uniref:hypothetical protein n=1 Tax=Arenimonas sp. TaxID=1872635 RepID=UPI0025C0D90C|nr:hypothetical protein [Arenimonas sp.]MBW8366974.1 hypothetical protein [Arenimonas sp.]